MLVNINTYFSLRAKCCLRGGVGGQFPSNVAVTYGLLKVPDITKVLPRTQTSLF